ncbi:MAG: head decoration protein [bacterium]
MPCTFLASQHGVDARISITIAQGYNLAAGTVLGKITASGKYGPYSASATDGRQTAVGILAEAVDATNGDKGSFMLVHGIFFRNAITGLDATAESQLKGCIFI